MEDNNEKIVYNENMKEIEEINDENESNITENIYESEIDIEENELWRMNINQLEEILAKIKVKRKENLRKKELIDKIIKLGIGNIGIEKEFEGLNETNNM